MTDLYDKAAALPRLLRGAQTPRRYDQLIRPGTTRAALRWAAEKGRLQRPFRGVYLSNVEPLDLLDTIRSALLVTPPASVIGHQTAAMLYGFGVVPAPEIDIVVPAGTAVPQRRGVVAHESTLALDGVTDLFGFPCLPPARCALDLARSLPRPDALAVLDAALHVGACTATDLVSEVSRHDRLRGIRQARELVTLATPLAECRQESHLRLLLHDDRLPSPTPQLAVIDEWGVLRYRMDLGYEEHRVGLEYDGASHAEHARLRSDRRRHNWLAERGWRMRYFTDHDLYRRPDLLIATVRAALSPHRSRNFSSIKDLST